LRADGTFAAPPGGGFARSSCRARRDAGISLPSSTETQLTWNLEDHDDASYHSTTLNTDRFTAPANGYYRLSGTVYITGGGTAEAYVYFGWGGGGSNPFGAGTGGTYGTKAYPFTASVDTGIIYMTSGQYVFLNAYVTSGTSVTMDHTGSHITFERLS